MAVDLQSFRVCIPCRAIVDAGYELNHRVERMISVNADLGGHAARHDDYAKDWVVVEGKGSARLIAALMAYARGELAEFFTFTASSPQLAEP